jgi:hypothetical protein
MAPLDDVADLMAVLDKPWVDLIEHGEEKAVYEARTYTIIMPNTFVVLDYMLQFNLILGVARCTYLIITQLNLSGCQSIITNYIN